MACPAGWLLRVPSPDWIWWLTTAVVMRQKRIIPILVRRGAKTEESEPGTDRQAPTRMPMPGWTAKATGKSLTCSRRSVARSKRTDEVLDWQLAGGRATSHFPASRVHGSGARSPTCSAECVRHTDRPDYALAARPAVLRPMLLIAPAKLLRRACPWLDREFQSVLQFQYGRNARHVMP